MSSTSPGQKTFAVAFFSLHTNELHIELITAPTWQEAAKAHKHTLFDFEECTDSDLATVQLASELAFNNDGGFSIIELAIVPNPIGTNHEIVEVAFPLEVLGKTLEEFDPSTHAECTPRLSPDGSHFVHQPGCSMYEKPKRKHKDTFDDKDDWNDWHK